MAFHRGLLAAMSRHLLHVDAQRLLRREAAKMIEVYKLLILSDREAVRRAQCRNRRKRLIEKINLRYNSIRQC